MSAIIIINDISDLVPVLIWRVEIMSHQVGMMST